MLSPEELNEQLKSAIRAGDFETIKKLVRVGSNLDTFSVEWYILLGSPEIASYLKLVKNPKTRKLADLLY